MLIIVFCVLIDDMSMVYSNVYTLFNYFRETMQVRTKTPMLEAGMKTQTGETGAIRENICCLWLDTQLDLETYGDSHT